MRIHLQINETTAFIGRLLLGSFRFRAKEGQDHFLQLYSSQPQQNDENRQNMRSRHYVTMTATKWPIKISRNSAVASDWLAMTDDSFSASGVCCFSHHHGATFAHHSEMMSKTYITAHNQLRIFTALHAANTREAELQMALHLVLHYGTTGSEQGI